MTAIDLDKPFIPVSYGLLMLEVAGEQGLDRERFLALSGVPASLMDNPDSRLTMRQGGAMLYVGMQETANPAFGYEIGLHSHLTSHGLMGYGLLSSSSLRDAIEMGRRFLQLRLPNLSISLIQDDLFAGIEVRETLALGPLRRCMLDLFLVGLARMAPALANRRLQPEDMEMWFDYAEPDYFAAYRDRLPPARFNMPSIQLRFPAKYLDVRMETANPVTVRMVTEQCDRELEQLGLKGDIVGQVRAILRYADGRFPDLPAVAGRLFMSSRTLKRRLGEQGVTYRALVEELRRSEAMRLLRGTHLSMEMIATRLGYNDPANFTRAFRRWTGQTPSVYRSGNIT